MNVLTVGPSSGCKSNCPAQNNLEGTNVVCEENTKLTRLFQKNARNVGND